MIINHNIAALNTYRQLSNNNVMGQKALEKLSSGLRINKAGDDAAGLAISEKMRAQIRGLDQASRNAQDAISLIQTAEGGLNETHSILQRMRELATQAASDTNVDIDRAEIQKEINQLTSEINRIGNTTEFNTMKLLNGGTSKTSNIRYSVETAGMAEIDATGGVSAVNVVTNSVKASTAAVSAITVTTDSVAAAGSAEGGISQPVEDTGSSVAGTGDIQLFRVDTNSVKVANAGDVEASFSVDNASVLGGTGAVNRSVIVEGAAGAATATYGLEITANFTAGDTIELFGSTFTAVAGAPGGAGEFTVGNDLEETRDNLLAALNGFGGGGANQATFGGVTYDLTTNDPSYDNGGYADNNLIVFTNTAGDAADAANDTLFDTTDVLTQVGATKGVYSFEVVTNYEVGQTITLGGVEFTAVAAGSGNTATTFEVGTDNEATAANIKAMLDQSSLAVAEGGNYNIAIGAAGIYSDTITLTENVATGNDLATPITGDVAEVQGVYSFEIKDKFSVGDKITIDGQEFTAVEAGGGNTATTFEIGDNVAAIATNLAEAIDANATLSDKYEDAAVGAGAFGNNRITLTEEAGKADGDNLAAPTVDQVDEVQGEYTFSLVANFAVGEKITIGGQEFEAVAVGKGNSATTFEVGADTNATAANLKAAMEENATLDDHYTIALAGSDFTVTEKAGEASGSALTMSATSAVGEVQGDFKFAITSNFSDGDIITIDGVDFTAKTSGAVIANGEFNIGANLGATTDNLIAALNDAGNATSTRFTASKLPDNTDPLNPSYEIRLYEKNAQATGTNLTDPNLDLVQEVQGVYTFDVEANFADGDRLVMNGTTLVAGDDFNIGEDADATAASIIDAINDHATLGDRFTATVSGNSIALTENATKATGENLADPDVKGDAKAGEYKFQMSALKAGSTVNIDGKELTLATGGNETETAVALKEAIENDATLNAKYTVAASGAEVTLTQKEGQETATAPTLSYTTQAGDGFRTQMQIGANTGQSMSLDVNDMRANALGVTSTSGTAGQTVEVYGKQFAVAWTSTQSVTNGTDDVAVEFALDVSTHDNATAAVKVINDAIESVSAERSKLGAYQNRLEHTINNLGTSSENLTAAESRVRDVDMAKEMMEFTKNNILAQAAQAMLAQANQQPQGVLQLLR